MTSTQSFLIMQCNLVCNVSFFFLCTGGNASATCASGGRASTPPRPSRAQPSLGRLVNVRLSQGNTDLRVCIYKYNGISSRLFLSSVSLLIIDVPTHILLSLQWCPRTRDPGSQRLEIYPRWSSPGCRAAVHGGHWLCEPRGDFAKLL